MRILVAESEEVTAATLQATLTAMGHSVVNAIDGVQAWRILNAEDIRLVIAERAMPKLDGASLCLRVRQLADRPYIYIILSIDQCSRVDRIHGLRAGADDLLLKPIDREELTVRLEIAQRILRVHIRLEQANRQLAELTRTDELTGLANRREFERQFATSLAMASRQRAPLSLMLLDIDHFKAFNDTFGHPVGDSALREFAAAVRATSRHFECPARLGGEEFGMVLFGACAQAARSAAERIREALARTNWLHRPITASVGLATTGQFACTAEQLMEAADQALYDSKRRGRNRVTHYDDLHARPTEESSRLWSRCPT